ncbi:MAG TPA: hypothetical protein VFU62_07990 [Hanamia sp.]|nr:hypothetical protein [Hanamia sp.]
MNNEHVISEELFEQARFAFSKGEHWIAYNEISYCLEQGDMYFFKTSDEAHEFSNNNISEYDNFRVIHADSIVELLKQIPYGKIFEEIINSSQKKFIMNEQNFGYLKDNIKYLGFGEKQHDELEKNLSEGKESFQMAFKTEVNKKPFEAVLQFRKSENSDMYFLNNYYASLERTNGDKMEQTFFLNKGKGVTAKEAYNLLEGRAVFKELTNKAGEPYQAWIQLDFENKDKNNNNEVKQYHENYGYDLRTAVGKYAVQELDGGEKEKSLMHSLQKGNVQSVTIDKDGVPQKMFIEANPQFKTVTLYDEHLKRVQKEDLGMIKKKEMSEPVKMKAEQKSDLKQDNKKEAKMKSGKDLAHAVKKHSKKRGVKI